MKRMTYVAVPALLVLLVFSLGGSAVWGDSIMPPDDKIVKPIDPPIGPIKPMPVDPCFFSDLTLALDKLNLTASGEVVEDPASGGSWRQTIVYPLQYEGATIGYLKVVYNRLTVSTAGDPLNFITARDIFYFPGALVIFGERALHGPIPASARTGKGVVTKITDANNNVVDLDLKYTFDLEDEEVCFFTY